jgi:hypothetical protein
MFSRSGPPGYPGLFSCGVRGTIAETAIFICCACGNYSLHGKRLQCFALLRKLYLSIDRYITVSNISLYRLGEINLPVTIWGMCVTIPTHKLVEYGMTSSIRLEKFLLYCLICLAVFIALTSGLSTAASAPATAWEKNYGGATNNDKAESVWQTSDCGFIICGETDNGKSSLPIIFLTKTDWQGNLEWTQTYPATTAKSVKQTSDGGYIVAGSGGNGAVRGMNAGQPNRAEQDDRDSQAPAEHRQVEQTAPHESPTSHAFPGVGIEPRRTRRARR